MPNRIYNLTELLIILKHKIVKARSLKIDFAAIYILVTVCIAMAGCANVSNPNTDPGLKTLQQPKLFVVILDALQRKTLMESLDDLPSFKAIIKGDPSDYPYIYFENVLVSIPSSSKPSNTTLLTGMYPDKHGVPSTNWFDRKNQKNKTLTSISQRRIVDILDETNTDTLFDYARKSGRTTMAVATQVTKGVESHDWIQQSIHLWGQAYCLNLFLNFNPIPDGAHLDRGTTVGFLKGHMYSLSDGLEGKLRTSGDIPDLTVVHYVGMDIFTHYPRRFMVENNWSINEIQKWYLKEVLDPEIGTIKTFLQENNLFDNTVFFFVSDHGQGRISQHIDEKDFEKRLAANFKVMGRPYSADQAEIVISLGASTKTLYVKNRLHTGWMIPPRLLTDVKPVVDTLIDIPDMQAHLNALLVARYSGERDEFSQKSGQSDDSDPYWFFNLSRYRQSDRQNEDFLDALDPLARLDELVGQNLKAAYMYRRDFVRRNVPDIILINKPGYFFTPDRGKYAHHGSIYPESAYVSFIVSGPAVHRFSASPQTICRQIDTVDMVPMAAYLADIKIDRPIDGVNQLIED